jgi:hypothetical protein
MPLVQSSQKSVSRRVFFMPVSAMEVTGAPFLQAGGAPVAGWKKRL